MFWVVFMLVLALLLLGLGFAFELVSLMSRRWFEADMIGSTNSFHIGLFTYCIDGGDCHTYNDVEAIEVKARLEFLQALCIMSTILYGLAVFFTGHLIINYRNLNAWIPKWCSLVCTSGGAFSALASTFLALYVKETDASIVTDTSAATTIRFLNENTLDTSYGYSFHLCWASIIPAFLALLIVIFAMSQVERPKYYIENQQKNTRQGMITDKALPAVYWPPAPFHHQPHYSQSPRGSTENLPPQSSHPSRRSSAHSNHRLSGSTENLPRRSSNPSRRSSAHSNHHLSVPVHPPSHRRSSDHSDYSHHSRHSESRLSVYSTHSSLGSFSPASKEHDAIKQLPSSRVMIYQPSTYGTHMVQI